MDAAFEGKDGGDAVEVNVMRRSLRQDTLHRRQQKPEGKLKHEAQQYVKTRRRKEDEPPSKREWPDSEEPRAQESRGPTRLPKVLLEARPCQPTRTENMFEMIIRIVLISIFEVMFDIVFEIAFELNCEIILKSCVDIMFNIDCELFIFEISFEILLGTIFETMFEHVFEIFFEIMCWYHV